MRGRDRNGREFIAGAAVLWRAPGKEFASSYAVRRIEGEGVFGDRALLYDGAIRWVPCDELVVVYSNLRHHPIDEPPIPCLDDVDYCSPNDPTMAATREKKDK